jgi:hypothetical protein
MGNGKEWRNRWLLACIGRVCPIFAFSFGGAAGFEAGLYL